MAGKAEMIQSSKDYDWLGPGIYFWESDPLRAWEWADYKAAKKDISEPFVIGAVIDLGHCLDLLSRNSLETLRTSYDSFVQVTTAADDKRQLPQNRGQNGDKLLRFLDCAVVRHLHEVMGQSRQTTFDSVRGLFTEGDDLFPGSGFKAKTHVQIAVCKNDQIKGTFRVSRPK